MGRTLSEKEFYDACLIALDVLQSRAKDQKVDADGFFFLTNPSLTASIQAALTEAKIHHTTLLITEMLWSLIDAGKIERKGAKFRIVP